jgi:hypothetical protein
MTTFNEMIDEVSLHLSGYGMRHDAVTHLEVNATSSAEAITVDDASELGRGMIEIDDELIWVKSFDRATGILTVPPYGRGYSGTAAAAHTAGTKVTVNPTFSRHAIKKALNDTVRAVFPNLYGVGSTTFTYSPAQSTYSLPNEAQAIFAVSYETIGSSKEWQPIRGWRVDPMANVSAFSSNNSITLTSGVEAGRTVQVTYSFEPAIMESNSDDFSTVTGLADSAKDVIVLGAAYRLLSFLDPGRLSYTTPESEVQSGRIQFGSGTNVAKYVYALYQQRLQDETNKLLGKFPVRVHYTN